MNLKPDKSVLVPPYDCLTEGFDPRKCDELNRQNSERYHEELARRRQPEIFYFGCLDHGHYLHSKRNINIRYHDQPWMNPLDGYLDGCLLSKTEPQIEGACVVLRKDGWTVISFWDRSGDKRPNSNSAFLVRAVMSVEEIIKLARQQWPEVFSRPKFPTLNLIYEQKLQSTH